MFQENLGSFAYLQVLLLLLLLLSRFSRVRLCVTPQTAAHQAPPSLGFSRQEHWSGLLQFQISDKNFLRPSFEVKVGSHPASLRADMRIYRLSMPACVVNHCSRVQLLATP